MLACALPHDAIERSARRFPSRSADGPYCDVQGKHETPAEQGGKSATTGLSRGPPEKAGSRRRGRREAESKRARGQARDQARYVVACERRGGRGDGMQQASLVVQWTLVLAQLTPSEPSVQFVASAHVSCTARHTRMLDLCAGKFEIESRPQREQGHTPPSGMPLSQSTILPAAFPPPIKSGTWLGRGISAEQHHDPGCQAPG